MTVCAGCGGTIDGPPFLRVKMQRQETQGLPVVHVHDYHIACTPEWAAEVNL